MESKKITKYINKETGVIEDIEDIKYQYNELINNCIEFDEYIDNFEKYLRDFYK